MTDHLEVNSNNSYVVANQGLIVKCASEVFRSLNSSLRLRYPMEELVAESNLFCLCLPTEGSTYFNHSQKYSTFVYTCLRRHLYSLVNRTSLESCNGIDIASTYSDISTDDINSLLDRIPDITNKQIILYKIMGYTLKEIGQSVGLSIEGVRKRLLKMKSQLVE